MAEAENGRNGEAASWISPHCNQKVRLPPKQGHDAGDGLRVPRTWTGSAPQHSAARTQYSQQKTPGSITVKALPLNARYNGHCLAGVSQTTLHPFNYREIIQ